MNKHDEAREAWWEWMSFLSLCPRVAVSHLHTLPPMDGCPCDTCEDWIKANQLQDEYRRLRSLIGA